jgi:TRAP-type C4-dicarboxylate transport system permease small subunit
VWIIFLGASVATKRGSHLAIQFFSRLLAEKYQIWIRRFVYAVILLFLLFFIIASAKKTIENIEQQIQAFPVTIAWFYLAMPVGASYMFIDYLFILLYGKHPFLQEGDEE